MILAAYSLVRQENSTYLRQNNDSPLFQLSSESCCDCLFSFSKQQLNKNQQVQISQRARKKI